MNKAGELQLHVHGPFTLCGEDMDILGDCHFAKEAVQISLLGYWDLFLDSISGTT